MSGAPTPQNDPHGARHAAPPSEGLSADSERTAASDYDEKKPKRSFTDEGTAEGAEGAEPTLPAVFQDARDPGAAGCTAGGTPSTPSSALDEPINKEKSRWGFGRDAAAEARRQQAKQDEKDVEAQRPRDIYDRFPPRKKRLIVAIVAYSAFLGPMMSSAFLPSITQMSHDLHTTAEMINYTVAIFIVAVGLAPIFWSPLAGFYGRKVVFLLSMPIMAVASVGVAVSPSVGALIATRVLQGIGSSSVLSVGAGTVGDIYRPTERANAMAWFYSGVVLGPALSPVIGGIFTEYTADTWRSTQYFLCGCSVLAIVLVLFFLPETSHPPLPHHRLQAETGKRFVWYWFNPVKSLAMLKYYNLITTTVASSMIMIMIYCTLVPLGTIFHDRYNITNAAVSGCIYLASGGGTLVASRLIGPYADTTVKKWIARRGYRRPEDRLRASLLGTAVVAPCTAVIYGWLMWADRGGLAPLIVLLALNGAGYQLALTPINVYLVDAAQKRSAEALAVNNFARYLCSAAASAFVLPMMNRIGPGWTMTVAAALTWAGAGCILATIRWGEQWREGAAARTGKNMDGTPYVPRVPQGPHGPHGGNAGEHAQSADLKEMEARGELNARQAAEIADPEEAAIEAAAAAGPMAGADIARYISRTSVASGCSHTASQAQSASQPARHAARKSRPTSKAKAKDSAVLYSDDEHADELAHGEPGLLPRMGQPVARALTRERSRRGSRSSVVHPTVGEVLERTVSLSGASLHGGG